mgnify:CR=1 FL=1
MNATFLMRTALIALPLAAAAPAQAWWKCPDGLDLQTRTVNNAMQARCYKPQQTLTQSVATNCPLSSAFTQDYYSGGADACVTKDPSGTAHSAVPFQFCPTGYTHNKIAGRDVCTKSVPAVESIVNLKV